jgi:hypothetical protein
MAQNIEGVMVPAGQQFKGVTGGGLKVKTLKRLLKLKGLKTTGKKATLRARAKKARILRGGVQAGIEQIEGAEAAAPATGTPSLLAGGRRTRRHRHRRSRSLFRKFF